MIIRESGMVVGFIDDETMETTEIESVKLQGLIDDWRNKGIFTLQAVEGSTETEFRSQEVFMPFAPENIGMIENELLKAGFEVQTA